MLRRLVNICILLFICFFAKAQDFSNKGKEFWVGYGYHQAMVGASNSQDMVLYFTSDVSATVKVEIPGVGWSKTYQVAANTVTESDAMPKAGSQDARLYADSLYNTGIHITSDNPIVAYAHIYSSTNSGASLLFPVNTLGQDYYSLNFTQKSNTTASNSWAFVIATEDNTTVEITPSANTLTHPVGVTFPVTLNKGQIYNLMGTTSGNNGVDLTGTRIRSVSNGISGCKRIAVFSGSGRVSINCENAITSSDNLFQQVFPQSAWGKKFLTVPTLNLPNNYFRIAVSDPSTNVTVDGVKAANLINNFYYEFTANTPKNIVADKSVMVAQYITSANDDITSPCGNAFNYNGDPEMIYLSPLEQTIDNVTLNSTPHYKITSHYINVVIKSSAVKSFTLDGGDSSAAFKTHPGDPAYSFAVFQVKQGPHQLKADSGFNAIAYGYGEKESYGYNAGTNIKNLYEFLTVQNPYELSTATCTNTPFYLSVTLPYQPTSLVWDFGNNPNLIPSQNITQNSPVVADSSYTTDGRTLYVYKLKAPFKFNTTGAFPVKIMATNQSSDGCNGQQEIDYAVQVFTAPQADFSIIHAGCAPDTLRFINATNANGNTGLQWKWEFGDTTTDTVANPSKIYTNVGTYNIKLTSINNIGCFTDTTKPFTLTQPPVAKFGFPSPICANSAINLTDSSTVATGNIVKWFWDFGDGNAITNTINAVSKSYNKPGNYTIQLTVQSDSGCKSNTVKHTVTVTSSPVTNFTSPQVCINDPAPTFSDSSYIPGGLAGALTYSWNFGDQNSTASNPNTSAAQSPQHQFSSAGIYNISLTTTSSTGCSSAVTKPFAVNGVPHADFILIDSAAICGNSPVRIQNNSTVSPGSITKIEILWDADTAPATVDTDNNPSAAKIYSHTFPALSTARTYNIKMRAFSGIGCADEKVVPILVKPSPKVTFSALPAICSGDSAYTITQAKETTGLPGTFVFSGKGVSPEGQFYPSEAGAGVSTITYIYTSNDGCKDSAEQTITVVQNPTIQLPPKVYALVGGSVFLEPVITGNISKYTWSPATWLDNANTRTPRSTPAGDITYKLMVSTPEGCNASGSVMVALLTAPVIPTAFSPNGDGINDVWNIPSLQSFSNCTVQVFNRYGKIVFSSTGYPKPWDGSYNGSILPVGVYYYIINVGNGKKPYAGSITILK